MPLTGNTLISANRVGFYYQQALADGLPAEAILAGTRLMPHQLTNGRAPITVQQYLGVVSNLVRHDASTPGGIAMGSAMPLQNLGVLGYTILTSPSMGHTHRISGRWASLYGGAVRVKHHSDQTRWHIESKHLKSAGSTAQFCAEEMAGSMLRVIQLLTGDEARPSRVTFRHPKPADMSLYEQVFDCRVDFDEPSNMLEFSAAWLEEPALHRDMDTHQACARKCDELVARYQQTRPITAAIYRLLMASGSGQLSLDKAAEDIGVHPATLRRLLHQEGTSYRSIGDHVRAELAKHYLKSGDLSPKEVAYRLGFGSVNNFYRAFKRWSGWTVREWRQSNP